MNDPDDRFVVAIRARSAAHFPQGKGLSVNSPVGTAVVVSEHEGGENGWPLTLRGELRGSALSLDDAQNRFGDHLSRLFPLVALAANAAVADPRPVGAHGINPKSGSRDWIGYEWIPSAEDVPRSPQTVEPGLVGAILLAADACRSNGYWQRAAGLYREALKYWSDNTTLLLGEYLWMATEALTHAVVEVESAQLGITPNNLAKQKGVNSQAQLLALERETLFDGDAASVKSLEDASDGFEHSFKDVDEVRALVEPIIPLAARQVRRGLIRLLKLSKADESALLSPEYDEPRPLVSAEYALRGELRVDDSAAATDEIEAVVEMAWEQAEPTAIGRNAEGKLEITRRPKATVRFIPPGISLDVKGAAAKAPGASKFEVSNVEVQRADDA